MRLSAADFCPDLAMPVELSEEPKHVGSGDKGCQRPRALPWNLSWLLQNGLGIWLPPAIRFWPLEGGECHPLLLLEQSLKHPFSLEILLLVSGTYQAAYHEKVG